MSAAFAAPATAHGVAPIVRASWITVPPTPPDAPVRSSVSPARTAARRSMPVRQSGVRPPEVFAPLCISQADDQWQSRVNLIGERIELPSKPPLLVGEIVGRCTGPALRPLVKHV